jgi:hypothetical protein
VALLSALGQKPTIHFQSKLIFVCFGLRADNRGCGWQIRSGAREGLEIEACYHALSRKSSPDLAKLGISRDEISQAALKGTQR